MSNLLVQNIKHTNNTTAVEINSSAQMTVKGEGSATTNLQQGLSKVWSLCTADGTTVRDSFNVSGIADTATGKQTISYTNPFNNEYYCANLSNTGGSTKFLGVTSPAAGSMIAFGFNADDSGFSDTQIAASLKGDLA